MTSVQPPQFAARLLKRLVPAQNHEALLGDLCEEYQRRRSLTGFTGARNRPLPRRYSRLSFVLLFHAGFAVSGWVT